MEASLLVSGDLAAYSPIEIFIGGCQREKVTFEAIPLICLRVGKTYPTSRFPGSLQVPDHYVAALGKQVTLGSGVGVLVLY